MGTLGAGSVSMLSTKPVRWDPKSGDTLYVNVPLKPDTAVKLIAKIREIFPPIEGMSHLSLAGFIATAVQTLLDLDEGQSLTIADLEEAVLKAIAKSLADSGRTDPRIREDALA